MKTALLAAEDKNPYPGKEYRREDTISLKIFTAALQNPMSNLNWEDKGYLINKKMLPAMCYATETWPENKTIAKAMQTIHRGLERSFLKTAPGRTRSATETGIRANCLFLSASFVPYNESARECEDQANHGEKNPSDAEGNAGASISAALLANFKTGIIRTEL
ncbi:hypothetical protein OSTOST_05535, partial [Ostertagia ostertagi]